MAVEAVEAAEAAGGGRARGRHSGQRRPTVDDARAASAAGEDYSQIRESGWEERAWEAEKPASVEDVLRDAGAEALARLDETRRARRGGRRWGGGRRAVASRYGLNTQHYQNSMTARLSSFGPRRRRRRCLVHRTTGAAGSGSS